MLEILYLINFKFFILFWSINSIKVIIEPPLSLKNWPFFQEEILLRVLKFQINVPFIELIKLK